MVYVTAGPDKTISNAPTSLPYTLVKLVQMDRVSGEVTLTVSFFLPTPKKKKKEFAPTR